MNIRSKVKITLLILQWVTMISVSAACFATSTDSTVSMLQPDDFAFGIELSPGESSIRRFRLPYEVFKVVTRGDYGDLRVFNAQGQSVPFVIEAEPTSEQQAYQVALEFFPLPDKAPSTIDQQLDVQVERRSDSEIFTLNATSVNAPSTALTESYIIDNSNRDDPLERLHLKWDQQGESLIGQLQVQTLIA